MISKITQKLRRFWRDEEGSVTVEFAILFPALITVMIAGIEIGVINIRHTVLERSLDLAVRELRLGTGKLDSDSEIRHTAVKSRICEYGSGILGANCMTTLRLEMKPVDTRGPTSAMAFNSSVDCYDVAEPLKPVTQFTPGLPNQLMLIRACLLYRPLFPTAGLGRALQKNSVGQASMISFSSFVQEPL